MIKSLVGLKRVVRQFNFTAWPTVEKTNQFGDPQDFIQFVEIIRKETSQLLFSSPIAVHCRYFERKNYVKPVVKFRLCIPSTGVDGTGTFIALDYLIQQALRTDVVDVAKTVHHLRHYNLSMVQLEVLCDDVITYYLLDQSSLPQFSCVIHLVTLRFPLRLHRPLR